MTNPTSNFGWQMPTPTDLVTDLPADFEVFGQAVDTSMADLKGGTTGQILSKATNADMDFTWIANDQGDITAVNVTSPITGGGSAGAVTIGVNAASTSASGVVQLSDSTSTTSSVLASTPTATKSAYDLAAAAVPKSTVTTAGDVIYATGSSAVTRLGIGSAGQVLTVAAGVPSWAAASSSGMTSIASGSLSGASVVINSIAGTYNNLQLVLRDYYMSTNAGITLKVNAIANYNLIRDIVTGGTVTRDGLTGNSTFSLAYNNIATSDNDSSTIVNIYDYTSSVNKNINALISYTNTSAAKEFMNYNGNAVMNAAVTSITLATTAGNFSGGTYILYGVN